jgi:hypothetical protein
VSLARPMRLIDEPPEPATAPPPEPKVFVRSISTPPGLPWDQARTAALEARHGAPLPLGDVLYCVRRLSAWRPGAPGRFAAMYVLAREVSGAFETTVEIEGRPLRQAFRSPQGQAAQRRRRTVVALLAAATSGLVVTAVGAALVSRMEADARLISVEASAAAKFNAARAVQKLKQQANALDHAPDRGAPIHQVLEDLAWASEAKSPDAHVDKLHWERGVLALEVRGSAVPFASSEDHLVERAPRPLRKGVWLWGVVRAAPNTSLRRPFAATPLDRPPGAAP